MLEKTLILCGAFVCLLCVFFAFISWLDTPVMVKSHTSKKCVYWEDKDGRHTCDTAPENVEIVWGL